MVDQNDVMISFMPITVDREDVVFDGGVPTIQPVYIFDGGFSRTGQGEIRCRWCRFFRAENEPKTLKLLKLPPDPS